MIFTKTGRDRTAGELSLNDEILTMCKFNKFWDRNTTHQPLKELQDPGHEKLPGEVYWRVS